MYLILKIVAIIVVRREQCPALAAKPFPPCLDAYRDQPTRWIETTPLALASHKQQFHSVLIRIGQFQMATPVFQSGMSKPEPIAQ